VLKFGKPGFYFCAKIR